jgi:polyisoprenyl-phosphate glycosyltransferase
MSAKPPLVSLVCPAFNEEEVLPSFLREVCRVLDGLRGRFVFEVLFVDDGSSDGTLELLRRFARQDERVRYLSLSRNFGHQAAFFAGIEHARGDAVVLMDSDLQHPPALLPVLLARWREGHDVVVTLREGDRPGLLRGLAARGFVKLISWLSPLCLRERMTDHCLLSRRAAADLLRLRETHRYLRGMIQWLGYSVAEVAYRPGERLAGQSKFSLSRLLGYGLDGLISFTRAPLRLSYLMGLAFLLIGFTVTARGVLGNAEVVERAADRSFWLLASVHVVGGSILIAVGLVGEYVARVFEQVKGRPHYLLKETEPSRAALTTPYRVHDDAA